MYNWKWNWKAKLESEAMQGQLKNHLHKPKLENQFWQGKLQKKTWRPSWKVKRQLKSSTLSFKLEAGRLKTQNWTLKAAYRSLGHLTSRWKAKLEIWSPNPEASIIRLTYMHTYIYMYIYVKGWWLREPMSHLKNDITDRHEEERHASMNSHSP